MRPVVRSSLSPSLTFIEELYRLRSQKNEASQTVATLRVEVSELKMAADSSKVRAFPSSPLTTSSTSSALSRPFRAAATRS